LLAPSVARHTKGQITTKALRQSMKRCARIGGMRMRSILGVAVIYGLMLHADRQTSFEIVVAGYLVDLRPIHSGAGAKLSPVR
jgi:hypothetical protein